MFPTFFLNLRLYRNQRRLHWRYIVSAGQRSERCEHAGGRCVWVFKCQTYPKTVFFFHVIFFPAPRLVFLFFLVLWQVTSLRLRYWWLGHSVALKGSDSESFSDLRCLSFFWSNWWCDHGPKTGIAFVNNYPLKIFKVVTPYMDIG